MRILYLSLSYVPSRRASSVQVMKMCAAMARLGHEVELVAKLSSRHNEQAISDDHAFYGVESSFAVSKLARPPRKGGGLIFSFLVARHLWARRGQIDLVYCRDIVGAASAVALRFPVVFEAHGLPPTPSYERLWRRVLSSRQLVALVAISDALRRDIETAGLFPQAKAIVAHDAADQPRESGILGRRDGARARPRIGYVGSLYRGRGIDLILEVARTLPECQFDLVGGTEEDVRRWGASGLPENAMLHGFHPPSDLARFYREFDIMLMPYSRSGVVGATGRQDSSRWASPMKMFEYMASGVPLVASDLPVLQEVLEDGKNALIARSDDPGDWAAKIRTLLDQPELARRIAKSAREDLVQRFTWDARARHVLESVASIGSVDRRSTASAAASP